MAAFCVCFQNRAIMDSDETFVEDDEIKESDNPLYSTRLENPFPSHQSGDKNKYVLVINSRITTTQINSI